MISNDMLAALLIDMMDNLVHDSDPGASLHRLAGQAVQISGADAVGVVLADEHGVLHCTASSNESGMLLELLQLQLAEGPCLDCYRTAQPVVVTDLAAATDTWPHFAPKALDAGFGAVHAFPMRLREEVIGAVNAFGRPGKVFEPQELRVVQAMADVAAIAILQERSLTRAELLSEQLQAALDSRVVIEQAKGVVAHQEGLTPDAAFHRLRGQARRSGRKLTDVAREVIAKLGE